MIIGVISDSHPETGVAASAIEWLLARGADLLLHAEGIVASETLRLLRQSGKPYFEALDDEKAPIAFKTAPYNNDQALVKFKNDCNLRGEPFCTEFTGLRLKIMHHPFYLFDEEPAAQNEAYRPSFAADFGFRIDTDRAANFRKDFGADLVKNSSFSDEVSRGTNLGSNCGADHGEILIANSKATACSVNLNSNFNAADDDKILNGARRADENFKNAHSASANLKSGQSASLNVSLGANTGADVNSNTNLDLSLDADLASSPNANLNSNLTASSDPNTSGESKNRGPCERGADKISTIKIYDHTHFFAAAIDKNGALVLNPGEICGHKKRLSGLPVLWCKSENCAYFVSIRSAKNYKATERKS